MIASGPYATDVSASSDRADKPSTGVILLIRSLGSPEWTTDQKLPGGIECARRLRDDRSYKTPSHSRSFTTLTRRTLCHRPC